MSTPAQNPVRVLGAVVEQLEYGPRRADVEFVSSVAKTLCDDARVCVSGPSAYFHFEPALAPGDIHPIDVPLIPTIADKHTTGARGWAFATWLRLSPATRPSTAELHRSARPTHMMVARFAGAVPGAEVEIWLTPTDTPQVYKLSVRTASGPSGAGFRTAKKSQSADVSVRLCTLRWHHLAVSQTNPLLSVVGFKNSRVTLFVDGAIVFEQDLACPPMPFVRAGFGAGFEGDLAHPQLYAERLPYMHIAALYSRGPNAPTLHHALPLPAAVAVSPELQRAGLVSQASLDLLHDGMPLAGGTLPMRQRTGEAVNHVSGHATGLVPPVLLHLDAWSAVPTPRAVAASTTAAPGHASAPPAASSTGPDCLQGTDIRVTPSEGVCIQYGFSAPDEGRSRVDYDCPIWWSKGDATGDVAYNAKKTFAAIVALDVQVSNLAAAPALPGGLRVGTAGVPHSRATAPVRDSFHARLGAGVRLVRSGDVPDAAATTRMDLASILAPAHMASPPINTLRAWPAVGGVPRLLELIRTCPVLPSNMAAALGSPLPEMPLQDVFAGSQRVVNDYRAATGTGTTSFSDPIAAYLELLAALLSDNFMHREEMFQMRGFASLAFILLDRSRAASSWRSRLTAADTRSCLAEAGSRSNVISWAAGHPMTLETWAAAAKVLNAVRAWGSEWGPLFIRGFRFFLCDARVWTTPLLLRFASDDGTQQGHDASHSSPAAASPELTAPIAEHLEHMMRFYGSRVAVDARVVHGWSKYLSDTCAASPMAFRMHAPLDTYGFCDVMLAATRALAAQTVLAQARAQIAASTQWLRDPIEAGPYSAFAHLLEVPAADGHSLDEVERLSNEAAHYWARIVRLMLCMSLGAPVLAGARVASAAATGSPPEFAQATFDPQRLAADMHAMLQTISVLCQEHKLFQTQQEGLLVKLHGIHAATGSTAAFTFVVGSTGAADPFARMLLALLELLNVLLRSYPRKVHDAFELAKGTMAITACAEADNEAVRVAVMSVLSAVIALRRTMDPRMYGEDTATSRELDAASTVPAMLAGGAAGTSETAAALPSGTAAPALAANAAPPPTFASPNRNSVMSARDKQLRLLRVLFNALLDRPNTTSASVLAALQLVVAPDITGEGAAGTNPRGAGGRSSVRARGSTAGLGLADEIGISLTSQSPTASDDNPLSGYSDPDAEPPDAGSLSAASLTQSLTTAQAAILCPEALPIVFHLLNLASTALTRRVRIAAGQPVPSAVLSTLASNRRASAIFMEIQYVLQAMAGKGLLVPGPRGRPRKMPLRDALDAECGARVRVVLDLSLLMKAREGNSHLWMRQPGWQLWWLDLMPMPHAPRIARDVLRVPFVQHRTRSVLAGEGGEVDDSAPAVDVNGVLQVVVWPEYAEDPGNMYAADAGISPPSSAPNALEASQHAMAGIAVEALSTLLSTALEMESGFRVWMSTLMCVADKYKRDPKTLAAAKAHGQAGRAPTTPMHGRTASPPVPAPAGRTSSELATLSSLGFASELGHVYHEDVSAGIAYLICTAFERINRERPKWTPDLRANFLRTLRLAESRLCGMALARVVVAALPLLTHLRTVAKQQSAAAPSSTSPTEASRAASGASIPPDQRIDPLRGQEVWLVLELLVSVLPVLCGVVSNARVGVEPHRIAGVVVPPQLDTLGAVLAILHQMSEDEVSSLPDPDASPGAAPQTVVGTARASQRDLGGAFMSALTVVGTAITDMSVPPAPGGTGAPREPSRSSASSSGLGGPLPAADARVPRPSVGVAAPLPPGTASTTSQSAIMVVPGQGTRAGSGSRVEALMYIFGGLEQAIDASLHITALAEALQRRGDSVIPPAHGGDAAKISADAADCQSICIVLALAMVNNCAWGAWEHTIASFKDDAYMRNAGRVITRGSSVGAATVSTASALASVPAQSGRPPAWSAFEAPPSPPSRAISAPGGDSIVLTDVALGSPNPAAREASSDPWASAFSGGGDWTADASAAGIQALGTHGASPSNPGAHAQTNVPPPPLDRVAAVCEALAPALTDIQTRMHARSYTSVLSTSMKTPQIAPQMAAEAAAPTSAPATPMVDAASASTVGTGIDQTGLSEVVPWLRDILLSEFKPAPVHSVTYAVEDGSLRAYRRSQVAAVVSRLNRILAEFANKDKMITAHWTAVRMGLSRAARAALKARLRDVRALSGAHVDEELDHLVAVDDTHEPTHAGGAVGGAESDDVLEPVRLDSHEMRSRARTRLLAVKGAPIRAPTYAQFGKGASQQHAGRATAAAADDVARQLARAGAIKDVATAAADGDAAKDEIDEEMARKDEAALRAASAAADVSEEVGADDRETRSRSSSTADSGAESDDDTGDMASVATSVTAASVGASGGAPAKSTGRRGTVFAPLPSAVPDEIIETSADSSSASLAGVRGAIVAKCSLVKPAGYAPGTLQVLVSTGVVIWRPRNPSEPFDPEDVNAHMPDPDAVAPPARPRRFHVSTILAIFLRCFRLQDSAAELFVAPYGGPRKRRYFFAFEGGAAKRDEIVREIVQLMPRSVVERLADRVGGTAFDVAGSLGDAYSLGLYGNTSGNGVSHAYTQIPRPPPPGRGSGASIGFAHNYEYHFRRVMGEIVTAWRNRRLSNFDYLMALNTLAGRSFNDLTQYPVFPWVLADYQSAHLDLSNPAVYRDLTRPMGALTAERLKEFRSRFATFDDDMIPKFLYGSHYSTAVGTVVHYMLRLFPFTKIHLAYQDGHYDVADRLFSSVQEAWNLNTHSLSEVKELTPEWFSQAHFLTNTSRYHFGELQDGTRVDHVRLPPWAQSPQHFIRVMRHAMESEWVSSQLHHWVDLVFGFKQRGPAAVNADNVFYYLTYAGGVDIDAIEEPALRKATQLQIQHYGQTPLQVLRVPHPARGPHPVCAPVFIPASPASASHIALTATGSPAKREDPAKAAKRGGITTLRKVVGTVAAGVRSVGAAAAAASALLARPTGPALLGASRALAPELRRFAATACQRRFDAADAAAALRASVLPVPTLPSTDAIASHLASLTFSLHISRAFSHVCTATSTGASFWRVDTPCSLPLGLQVMFGGPHATAAILGDGVPPMPGGEYVTLAFGDVMVLGGAPPPATLVAKVPMAALDDVLDWRGPAADPWPRAFPDPYTTSPEQARCRHPLSASSLPKPFALPLRYHLVCELSGNTAVTPGAVDTVEGDDEAEAGAADAGPKFHVWWPIAPHGYVALGCVVTQASIVRVPRLAAPGDVSSPSVRPDPAAAGSPAQPQRIFITKVKPNAPDVAAVACVHISCTTPSLLDTFVAMPWLSLNVPPKAREEQVVFRRWGKKTAGMDSKRAAELEAPSPAAGGSVLRGWGPAGPIGSAAAGPTTTTAAAKKKHTGSGGPPPAGTLVDVAEEEPEVVVAPEDEWVVADDAAAPLPGATLAASHGTHILGHTEEDLDSFSDDELPSTAGMKAGADAGTAGSVIAASGVTAARVGRLRAHKSKAMAMFSVVNHVSSFVVPVPVSVQRADSLKQKFSSGSLTAATADAAAAAGAVDIDDLLAMSVATASKTGKDTLLSASTPDLLLASTPLPAVPQTADATYHKAHTLATAVAYDLSPAMLAKLIPAAAVPHPEDFFEQHWSADAALSGDGTSAPARATSSHLLEAARSGERAHVVAVRIVGAGAVASAVTSALPVGGALLPMSVLSAAPNTIVTVDALGQVCRFHVSTALTTSPSKSAAFVAHVSGCVDRLMSGGVAPIVPAGQAPHVLPDPYIMLPHLRIKLVRDAGPQTTFPLLPLRNAAMAFNELTASSSFHPQPRYSVGYPVALADMLAGAVVFTGTGLGGGVDMYALDMRARTAGVGPATTSPAPTSLTPLVPLAAKGKASLGKSIASTLASTASGAPETPTESPAWTGSGDAAAVAGGVSVVTTAAHAAVTCLIVEGDVLAAGFSDGTVSIWRVAGMDGLSALTSYPSLHTRPDVRIVGPTAGPVTSLAVSRDDDTIAIGYDGEAWLYEIARARPLQQLLLHVATGAVSAPRVVGLCITAEGGLLLATSTVVREASGQERIVSEIAVYCNDVTGAPAPQPVRRVHSPAQITCAHRVRGGGAGDLYGPGSLVALGRADGSLALVDARDLVELVSWTTPGRLAVYSIDVSPCTGYLVAGCANGVVAAFALPALPVVVAFDTDGERDDTLLASLASGALAVGGAALSQLENAKTVARSAKAIAGEASSVVKNIFGSIFGKPGGGSK